MKTGLSWILDETIKKYEAGVESHIVTQQDLFVASASLENAEDGGINLIDYKQSLLDATLADIEASYNHGMNEKLLDMMIDFEKSKMVADGTKKKDL